MRSSMFEYMTIFIQVVEQVDLPELQTLHLHRPVTKAIQHLEDELGASCLTATRKVTLTDEGDACFSLCLATLMTSWPLSRQPARHAENSG